MRGKRVPGKDPLSCRTATGRRAESLAARYLERHGLRVVERNYRCAVGEIDLVCHDGDQIVFVEVRSRRSTRYGYPEESISATKRKRLIRLAQWYLRARGEQRCRARFDIVALLWDRSDNAEIRWIINAFGTDC